MKLLIIPSVSRCSLTGRLIIYPTGNGIKNFTKSFRNEWKEFCRDSNGIWNLASNHYFPVLIEQKHSIISLCGTRKVKSIQAVEKTLLHKQ